MGASLVVLAESAAAAAHASACARVGREYEDQGLVVIGVHTPEFEFEKNLDDIRWAARDMNVDCPIAVVSQYAIWRAFGNEYWPVLYSVDARGHIRHHQFGEGEYGQSEGIIEQLLVEAGARGIASELVAVDVPGWRRRPICAI